MKKIIKIGLIGLTATFGLVAYRTVNLIKRVSKLKSELSAFLEKVYNEAPGLRINVATNLKTVITINLQYPSELLASSPDIEDDIREYISIHFPDLFKHKIIINITPKDE